MYMFIILCPVKTGSWSDSEPCEIFWSTSLLGENMYIERHAEYHRHTKSSLTGSLTSEGKIRAYDTGLYLQRAGVPPTVLFYSDMLRAQQTAVAIESFSRFFCLFCLPLLREVSYRIIR